MIDLDSIAGWVAANQTWLRWIGAASFLTLVGSLLLVPVLVVRMQPDYFLPDRDEKKAFRRRHPFWGAVGLVARNLGGGLLVAAGIVLSLPLVPGQGLLTILIGLGVMDFPGKRRIEYWLFRRRPVAWAIDRLRRKAGRPPLLMPGTKSLSGQLEDR